MTHHGYNLFLYCFHINIIMVVIGTSRFWYFKQICRLILHNFEIEQNEMYGYAYMAICCKIYIHQ